ncbi:hypothetical protein K437DRAFT_72081 [Tilletiaria anomala UBC 951]|uniref:Stealth protein CR2 conserved region 2 domain-containing protein n=1 Tax=Tilletiaria anomala (strain ATCC 24038 / CBS 436.72 / UBC 951) TaxID=1037660 RepID=A0A066WS12_TILAU|nr:uncharacterized protein K437DRAFT_72081 [Tilletiaria anomala UBC 951]KDN53465.1 hypothetical protein K437DRAFT_72081 [Tilletiaria anomala UBC 951]
MSNSTGMSSTMSDAHDPSQLLHLRKGLHPTAPDTPDARAVFIHAGAGLQRDDIIGSTGGSASASESRSNLTTLPPSVADSAPPQVFAADNQADMAAPAQYAKPLEVHLDVDVPSPSKTRHGSYSQHLALATRKSKSGMVSFFMPSQPPSNLDAAYGTYHDAAAEQAGEYRFNFSGAQHQAFEKASTSSPSSSYSPSVSSLSQDMYDEKSAGVGAAAAGAAAYSLLPRAGRRGGPARSGARLLSVQSANRPLRNAFFVLVLCALFLLATLGLSLYRPRLSTVGAPTAANNAAAEGTAAVNTWQLFPSGGAAPGNKGKLSAISVAAAAPAAAGTLPSGAELEPEWEWARDVSLVYTWVNGSDPTFAAQRKALGGQVGGNRDRDNEDLRFSLRTLHRQLPWHTGKIFIVSPSPPSWARLGSEISKSGFMKESSASNVQNSRLVWVHQDAIIPRDAQPTFSSNVVEQYLHLVPGLTEHFIHCNDDYMFVSPVHPRDFFTPTRGVRQYLEESPIVLPDQYKTHHMSPNSNVWRQSVYNTVTAIQKAYAPIKHFPPRWLKHAPFVYTRTAFLGMHQRFWRELHETSQNKFRSSKDVITPLLVHSYVAQEGSHALGLQFDIMNDNEARDTTLLVKWTSNDDETDRVRQSIVERIKTGKLKFLTINDEIGTGAGVAKAQAKLEHLYQTLFGSEKSIFEL